MWLRMPAEYLVSMLDWRRRIMAEEQMGAATVAMIPHMQKDDRERWSRTAMRDAQGSRQTHAGPTLSGPRENPPATFAGLPVIVETPV